jgi:lipid A 4'-phosphatase
MPNASPPPIAAPRPPAALRRARHRAGLVGLAVFAALAVVFTTWPGLDLWASDRFHETGTRFVGDDYLWVRFLYRAVPVIGWSYGAVSLIAILSGRWRPALVPFRWRRRAASLLLVSVLGSLLLINVVLKEHWGRARPREVGVLIGEGPSSKRFTPALEPTDQCEHNCSFTSGHAATGFVLMAVGLMGPVSLRRRWLGIGLATGLAASLARVMEGGHFLSDTLFSGWAIWACGWVLREAWLRRRAARLRAAR